MHRAIVAAVTLAMLMLLALPAAAEYRIPDPPDADYAIVDMAKKLGPEQRRAIEALQAETYAQHDTPIDVVIVKGMGAFGAGKTELEPLAREWFDQWEIGSAEVNTGILLLVSIGDRVARIELGADWGHDHDDHAKFIMDAKLVPAFKAGDYGEGIVAGVEALAKMAAAGPQGALPSKSLGERWQGTSIGQLHRQYQLGPMWLSWLALGLGMLCFAGAAFYPEQRKVLIIAGIAFMVAGICMWLILTAVLAIISPNRRRFGHYGSGGSFGGGGGGGGGGFSGGGGASGSW